jgi:hypothetical protein
MHLANIINKIEHIIPISSLFSNFEYEAYNNSFNNNDPLE